MDAAWEFFHHPDPERARALLVALGMHVPFDPSSHASATVRPSRIHRGGDARAYKLAPLPFLDVLHDLRGHMLVTKPTLDRLFQAAGLSASDKDAMYAAFRNPRQNYTRAVAQYVGVFADAERVTDPHLAARMAAWHQQTRLEIVLDGVVDALEVPLPPSQEWDFQRSLALYATVMLIFGRFDPRVSRLQEVTFLHGAFQYMDIRGWESFMKRWIRSMKQVCKPFAPNVQIQKIGVRDLPPYDTDVIVEPNAVRIRGVSVPIRPMHVDLSTAESPEDAMGVIQYAFGTTFPKETLRTVFQTYLSLPKHRQDAYEPFLHTVVRTNWLRDSYKADVAIRRHAVYITFDRIAHAYYMLRGSLENEPYQGIFLA